jgi:hypothetical protein
MYAMVQRVQTVLPEPLVRKVQPVHKVLLVHKVWLEHKVLQVQMVRTELTAQMDRTHWLKLPQNLQELTVQQVE